MKELDNFTVERLEWWINTPEKYNHRYSPRINCDELRALARISLAAKRAEPVAYGTLQKEFCDEERSLFTDKDSASKYSESCYDLTPLYTTPQLNHPVSPEGWKLVPIEPTLAMLTLLGLTGSFEIMLERYANMLAAAPEKP